MFVWLSAVALLCLGPLTRTPASPASRRRRCQADAELTVFDTGPSVICLQFALGMMHIFSEPITGVFDQGTLDAVTLFQATHPPLRVDGRRRSATLEALGIWSGKTDRRRRRHGRAAMLRRRHHPARPTSNSVDACRTPSANRSDDGPTTGVSDSEVDAVDIPLATPPLKVDGWAGPRTLAAMAIWSGNASGTATVTGAVRPPGPWPAPTQNDPIWNITPDGLPLRERTAVQSRADADMIAFQFGKDGADVATQQWAVYIATR